MQLSSHSSSGAAGELWALAAAGDRDAFARATWPYRRELELHCYRMVGALEDAEDLVQETLLRAWRRRETFQARSTLRAWLYGIATNACLDLLQRRRSRRLLPYAAGPAADPFAVPPPASEVSWLEPYPDRRLDELVDTEPALADVVAARETIELAFLVAIQQLPPRQRAVLILRDVIGWTTLETADLLGTSAVATKSVLQRARETVKRHLPAERLDWPRARPTDPAEQALLARYVDAWHRADLDALVALLAADARLAMPPTPAWYFGRDAIRTFLSRNPLAPASPQHLHVPTAANRQPAFAVFVPSETGWQPLALEVVRVHDGRIVAIDIFREPNVWEAFAVPTPA